MKSNFKSTVIENNPTRTKGHLSKTTHFQSKRRKGLTDTEVTTLKMVNTFIRSEDDFFNMAAPGEDGHASDVEEGPQKVDLASQTGGKVGQVYEKVVKGVEEGLKGVGEGKYRRRFLYAVKEFFEREKEVGNEERSEK